MDQTFCVELYDKNKARIMLEIVVVETADVNRTALICRLVCNGRIEKTSVPLSLSTIMNIGELIAQEVKKFNKKGKTT